MTAFTSTPDQTHVDMCSGSVPTVRVYIYACVFEIFNSRSDMFTLSSRSVPTARALARACVCVCVCVCVCEIFNTRSDILYLISGSVPTVCVCMCVSDFQHQVGHVDPLPADPQARSQALQVSHLLQVLRQLVLSLAARPHSLWNQTLQV